MPTGELLTVRPVRHDDGDLEKAFVLALSPETGYQRMMSGGAKATPEWIEYMTHIDYRRHMAYAITIVKDGAEQFIGVGRYVVNEGNPEAEFALVIADEWQRKGLGGRLLELLMEHARAAGVTEMIGVVLATNTPMLKLAKSKGFSASAEPDDATVKRVRRVL
jgi:acetyltransferase